MQNGSKYNKKDVGQVSAQETFVIVGAGLAGAKAAEALRAQGFRGEVVLVGDEAERPYDRPPLSKGYLLGKSERDEIYVHPSGWYAENDIDLRVGTRIVEIDRAAHEVSTQRSDSSARWLRSNEPWPRIGGGRT